MSVSNPLGALTKNVLGQQVSRATATLPATTQAAIFTITGRVLVTALIGSVTTATGATATTLKVTGNPTSGTDVDLSTAVSVASKEIGTIITLGATTVGAALSVQNAGGAVLPLGTGVVLNAGTLDIVTSATNTGSVKWDLMYVPLDAGASVTAAA